MTTKANRQRAKRKKPEHQADDVYIPSSLRKPSIAADVPDPLGNLCGEPLPSGVLCLLAGALCGGVAVGLAWAISKWTGWA